MALFSASIAPDYHVRDFLVNTDVSSGCGALGFMDTLPSRLKRAREARGLTQTELAKLAKVAQSTVGNIEAGKRQGASSLPALAHALQVNYWWLRDGDGSMAIPSKPWPFSEDLWNEVSRLQGDAMRRAENALRSHLDMPTVAKGADAPGASSKVVGIHI
jgi:transcriptional regulator with XRE-family HTH domain